MCPNRGDRTLLSVGMILKCWRVLGLENVSLTCILRGGPFELGRDCRTRILDGIPEELASARS
jgi:hypothetical protein